MAKHNYIDMTGKKFGRLTVICQAGKQGRAYLWKCRCDCGNEIVVAGTNLRRKDRPTTSCGCSRYDDLIGKKFGRLTVERFVGVNKAGRSIWACRCDCGNEVIRVGSEIKRGKTSSCGCYKKEMHTKHGETIGGKTSLYNRWKHIRSRCYNESDEAYHAYGGRGICMCEEWKNNYIAFREWALSNGYEEHLTIDRINVNGNYCPNNCRWVDMKVQNRNKRNNVLFSYMGEVYCTTEWAEILDMPSEVIRSRIVNFRWSVEDALLTPVKNKVA